jgi:hypothetical protein
MADLSKINDYASLRQYFVKTDTDFNAAISTKEAPDDTNKYDADGNGSVEFWEYMEAVNKEARRAEFNILMQHLSP